PRPGQGLSRGDRRLLRRHPRGHAPGALARRDGGRDARLLSRRTQCGDARGVRGGARHPGTPPGHAAGRTMTSLSWYWHRLRLMSAQELVARLGEQALLQYLRGERWWRFRAAHARRWQRHAFCRSATPGLPTLPLAFSATPEAARRLLDGEWG